VPQSLPGPESTVPELLRELEALRCRLEQAPEWFRRPPDTMRAGALAEEVKRLCQEASLCEAEGEIAELLAAARDCLDELQSLLGLQ